MKIKLKLKPSKYLLALNEGKRKKWADALVSGDYTQANGTLYDAIDDDDENFGTKCMCCLGVLEHINGRPIKDMLTKDSQSDLEGPYKITGKVPEELVFVERFKAPKGMIISYDHDLSPPALNDGSYLTLSDGENKKLHYYLKLSFGQIAKIIMGKTITITANFT